MTRFVISPAAGYLLLLAAAQCCCAQTEIPVISMKNVAAPPKWALMQRHVMEQLGPAAHEFVRKYTHDDHTLKWRREWPGFDGSDDGYESFYNFPLFYAIGGPSSMDQLSRDLWEGVTRQFTQYGQIHDEFDAHYDWMHHGESYTNFYFFGLSDPTSQAFQQRTIKFASLYLGDSPSAPNYDPIHKLIRSPINGSRGPHFVNTAEDWVTHRPILANYPLPFDDIPNVTSSDAWNDDVLFLNILNAMNHRMMRGDVPLNLTSTSLMLNAWMATGDERYRTWIEEYVAAWLQRVRDNNGILPDNVGLSGKIGEYNDGKWWSGYYGWKWPHGLVNQIESTVIGGTNAYLVSGNPVYLELPRSVIDLVTGLARKEGGVLLVPHRHGDEGWYDFRRMNVRHLFQLWFVSRADEDWERLVRLADISGFDQLNYRKGKGDSNHTGSWVAFVRGRNDDYPQQILESCYAETLSRLDQIRSDETTPEDQDVHHWQRLNPVILEGLVQLMHGAPNHMYHGGLLHASLRYFDPEQRRSGLPSHVAALVDRLTPDGVRLRLVNLHSTAEKNVVIQAGMFREHRFTRIRQVETYPFQFNTIDGPHVTICLAPGAVCRLDVGLQRHVNPPSYRFPWAE